MNFRFLRCVALAAFVPLACAQERTLTPEFLEELRAAVRAEHPSVAAAEARMRAADAAVRGVRLWEDPMVGVAGMAAEEMMRMDDGDLMFEVEQPLPRRKMYLAERAKMRAERGMAAAEFAATAVRLEKLIAQTAIELALTDEMIAIDRDQVKWVESIAANARERVKDPMGMASEALRMEAELAQERQKLESNVRMRQRLARQLNILLGRGADERWETLRLPAAGASGPEIDAELAKIRSANPMLQGLASAAEAAKSDVEIARRESKPMFSVGVESRIYSGGDYRSTTVGAKMTIPLFNRSKYRARVEQARDQQAAAEHEIAAMERELRSEMIMAYTDAENAARQAATLAGEVIPRAEKAAESTQNGWITGRANLLEALDARRVVLNARLEERRAIAAQAASLEMLRSIVPPKNGKDL